MPTVRVVRDELDSLLSYLSDSAIALYITPVSMGTSRVSWHPTSGALMATPGRRATRLADYLYWVEAGHYSAILYDGALLQVTYDIEGSKVVGHRLAYIPCPFELDFDLLLTEAVGDIVRIYAAAPGAEDLLLSGAIRFDYDQAAAGPGHPASHLTFNSTDCRIACHAPVRLGNFADFIFRNFYSTLWKAHPYFNLMPRSQWGARTLSDSDADRMHIAWRE
jgi:hypothetical protein